MISRLTKIQLMIFAIVTVLGGAFVGGRYAQVDRLFINRSYPVTAQFADSGGIFAGAQVTYRGIPVGKVGKLEFKDNGVMATLDLENSAPKVPADVVAAVANKSAIGEQFVDLQPRRNSGPYLHEGSSIDLKDTRIPIDTTTLLVDFNDLITSVDIDSVRTVVDELGQAFEGTGQDLGTILDTSTEFINAAHDNIDVSRALINNSASVLDTQIASQGALETFSRNLALFSDSLAGADPDLRRLADGGAGGAKALRQVVQENAADLSVAINNFVTFQRPVANKVNGLQAIYLLFPYIVEGGTTVPTYDPDTGEWDAAFGLNTQDQAHPCTYVDDGGEASGYRKRRPPADITDREFDTSLDCKVDNTIARQPSKTQVNRAAVSSSGEDSWKWLLLDPMTQ